MEDSNNIRVAVGVVIKHNSVLLIQRKLKEGLLNWQFPSGKIMNGEEPENAAIREVYEETNVICDSLQMLGSRIHPETNVKIYYVLCNYISGSAFAKDSRELSKIKWVRVKYLFSYIPTNMYPGIIKYFHLDKKG